MIYEPTIMDYDWRIYVFDKRRHPKLTVQDLKDSLKGLTAMERYRLYMGEWTPPEHDTYTKPTIT